MRPIVDLLTRLVHTASDTATTKEQDVEGVLLDELGRQPYFTDHPEHFGIHPLPGDPLGRGIVWGAVLGEGADTVVLVNHHDVVDVEDYGPLGSVAHDPEQLHRALAALDLDPDTRADLDSGDWLFGRGTADMKAGVALHLSALAGRGDRPHPGNLLMLSLPDEENLSAGMRQAGGLLDELADRFGLRYTLCINSEPVDRTPDGSLVVYDGSVGKTLIAVHVQGRASHIGEIFSGFNPLAVLGRIVVATELNADLSERARGERGVPPSWTLARDFKASYDASIPGTAGGLVTFFTLSRSPADTLEALADVCRDALAQTARHNREQLAAWDAAADAGAEEETRVVTYTELVRDATDKDAAATQRALDEARREMVRRVEAAEASIPESTFVAIDRLLEVAAYGQPTVVVALTPPLYPPVCTAADDPALDVLDTWDAAGGFALERRHFFMGISDLSYIGPLVDTWEWEPIIRAMPWWDLGLYSLPHQRITERPIPCLMLGPWGKDLHQIGERVYLPDVSDNVPQLLDHAINHHLGGSR